MAEILILFHSQTGNTEKLARAVTEGVEAAENGRARLKRADRAIAEDVKECGAIVICSPEYFGYMAGAVKDFFDRTYEELKEDLAIYRKPCAIVISAGNDGSFALASIERICKGYRFRQVQKPIICKGRVTEDVLAKCLELGSTIAEGVNAGIF
jgi:multimeric flavodoxin WrbA